MSQITPFTYIAVQHVEAQRTGAAEKERQLRRQNVLEQNIAAEDDVMEHQVESTEEVQAVGEEAEREKQKKKRSAGKSHHEEEPGEDSHIDLTA